MCEDKAGKKKLFEQLEQLDTEQRNENTVHIDLAGSKEIVRLINEEDKKVAREVEKKLNEIASAVELVKKAVERGGRLLYFGAGTSGRLGILDAAECPPTFGTDPSVVQGFIAGGREAMFVAQEGAEDEESNGIQAVEHAGVNELDVVCGLAASGRTPYVHGALKEGKRRGCATIFVTTVPRSQIKLPVKTDVMIDVPVGPEVITGSTRMKSATAQKMILNMITTGAMIRLGKVYENVMVDLMLTNQKLKERAKRIVMQFGGVEYSESEIILSECGGNVKVALIMAKTGKTAKKASKLLSDNDGFIRKVFQNIKS